MPTILPRLLSALFFLSLVTSRSSAADRSPSAPIQEVLPALQVMAFEDDHGGFYLAWTHTLPDLSLALRVQHINAGGQMEWSESDGSQTLHLDSAKDWTAFGDGRGGVTTVWRHNQVLSSCHWTTEGQSVWFIDHPISTSTATVQDLTGVADAAGGSYLLWSEKILPTRFVLKAQHLDASGTPLWTSANERVCLRPSDQEQPAIVFDAQAGVLIAWNDKRENASQLQMQRLDYQADRLWGAQGILITAPAGHDRPILSPLTESRSAVAWTGSQSASNRIVVQTLDAKGALGWGPYGVSISQAQGDEWNPVLSGAADGSLWVAWEDYRDQTHWNVFLTRLNAQGLTEWSAGEIALDPVSADQGHVALTDDGDGGLFVAWLDNRAGRTGIYLQDLSALGEKMFGPQAALIVDRLHKPQPPQVVPIAPGRVAVVWIDQTEKNHWSLSWKIIQSPLPKYHPID